MRRDGFHLCDHDVVKRRSNRRNFFDFETRHRQGMRKLIHRQLNFDEFFEPIYGNFHLSILLAKLAEKFDVILEK
jgi:hypothetical protein